ncbi:hypothetical protein Tco_0600480 [Tanacetum coccineum]|uniref:Uncharacterized protein n=1 Tax=Tanacetum coccineum TaxID=301880 RepID=A0ABQ4WBY6_9ASTR
MDESCPWDQKCKSSKELFKIKKSVETIFDGVERCKQTIAKRTYFVDTLKSQLETQKTQFFNEIDRLSREYYYSDHMNAILGVYTDLDEVTNLQYSLAKKDFSKSKPVTVQNVSNNFSKPVTAHILPQNMLPIVKNTNVIALGMYKVHTKPNQTRTSQLHQDIRKPNKRVSFSTGVIPTTSVSRPQPKSNQLEDREAMQQHVFYLKNRSLVFLDMRKPPYLISSMPETCQSILSHLCLSPGPQSPENVPQVAETVTTSNELELLYSPMFSELLNGTSHVVSKSSGCNAAIT